MKLRLVLATVAILTLAGCESSSEKAEQYYQSGLALFEKGDLDRASVELRNVFTYEGAHYEARNLLAKILIEKGNAAEGYSQYLRLVEQYPDDARVRRELAKLAVELGQWDDLERHGRAAVELEPESAENSEITLAMDYRTAALAKDQQGRAEVIADAESLAESQPDSKVAHRILIADAIDRDAPSDALDNIEGLIALDPKSVDFPMMKLRILNTTGDKAATEAYLQEVVAKFPDNKDVHQSAVAWYIKNDQLQKAEKQLRQIAGPDDQALEDHIMLIKFIEMSQGLDAAMAEADRLAEANTETPSNMQLYRSMQAYYMFQTGKGDAGIELLRETLTEAEPSEQTNRLKAMLASMTLKSGDRSTAESLIDEVLSADTTNVYALRLKAELHIVDDLPTDAINTLRQALGQNPRDTETLLLLATAYARAGNRELTGETLASAVDISGTAVEESLRYIDFLLADGRRGPAEAVLDDALEVNPKSLLLLAKKGDMALEDGELREVQQIADRLRQIEDDPRTARAADALLTSKMLKEGKIDEGLALLEQQAAQNGDAATVLASVRAFVLAGRLPEARANLDAQLAKSPDDPGLNLINAGLLVTENRPADAEKTLRDILAKEPGVTQATEMLVRIIGSQNRPEEAKAALAEGLEANPESRQLLLLSSAIREMEGDIDGAIADYETLYAQNSSDVIIANNLSSLLTTWRDDETSLERAKAVAQRLKGTDIPAFQDTYGWITYRTGDAATAITYLEPAAAALPNDPLVRYHLGVVQAKLGRTQDAKESLSKAIELGKERELPQLTDAQRLLASLDEDQTADSPAPNTAVSAGNGATPVPNPTVSAEVDPETNATSQSAIPVESAPSDTTN